ncbi:hypothetical protein [Sinorhizobium sp. 8-89]
MLAVAEADGAIDHVYVRDPEITEECRDFKFYAEVPERVS